MAVMGEAEMVEILEEIARQGSNRQAQIAAIKTLRDMRRDSAGEEVAGDDIDQLADRRNRQAA